MIIIFSKAHVRGHPRRLASGKVTFVGDYTNRKPSAAPKVLFRRGKHDDKTMDLFASAIPTVNMPPIVGEMLAAGSRSTADLRARISSVKLGPISGNVETIKFRLDDQQYIGRMLGRNRDAVVGISEEADKALALQIYLDGDASPIR